MVFRSAMRATVCVYVSVFLVANCKTFYATSQCYIITQFVISTLFFSLVHLNCFCYCCCAIINDSFEFAMRQTHIFQMWNAITNRRKNFGYQSTDKKAFSARTQICHSKLVGKFLFLFQPNFSFELFEWFFVAVTQVWTQMVVHMEINVSWNKKKYRFKFQFKFQSKYVENIIRVKCEAAQKQ